MWAFMAKGVIMVVAIWIASMEQVTTVMVDQKTTAMEDLTKIPMEDQLTTVR